MTKSLLARSTTRTAPPPVVNTGSDYLLNFKGANFLKWRRALALTRVGTSDSKILCVGDSTAAGIGGSTAGTVPQNKSWPAQLAAMMNTYMVPTTKGLATPKSRGTSQTADTRWSGGTGWALNSQSSQQYFGFGGYGAFWASATASTALTFADSTVTADTFDIYYVALSSNAGFTAQATGGSSVPVTQPGGSARVAKATVTAGSAGTGNTVTITHDATTSALFIVAVEPYLAGTKQVRVGNAGISGVETLQWVSYAFANSTNTYGGVDSIKAYAPNLSIIDLGINDAGVTQPTVATFISQLQTIIAACQVSGDVILKTMIPSDPTGSPNRVPLEMQYVQAIRGLGLPVVDMFSKIGSYSAYNGAGFMNDTLHGNDSAYSDAASTMFTALRAAA